MRLQVSALLTAVAAIIEVGCSDHGLSIFMGKVVFSDHGLWFYSDSDGSVKADRLCSPAGRLGPFSKYEVGNTVEVAFEGKRVGIAADHPPSSCTIEVLRIISTKAASNPINSN
jgi:hypothetical protein